MEQRIAVLVSVVLGATLIGVFGYVASAARRTDPPADLAATAARWRRTSLWGLVILFIPAIGYSLTRMPYPRAGAAPAPVVVTATGHQWAWEVTPDSVPAGQPVEIRVTGGDVNHGFALYDADRRIVVQTQAMPGYTNVIRHTFTAPGTYRVLCLEYCGLGHHTMAAQLVVTPAQGAQ